MAQIAEAIEQMATQCFLVAALFRLSTRKITCP